MLKKIIFLSALICVSFAKAESYFVEPLICKGQWNAQPPSYHSSYEYATLTVTSFKSVKAADCSLADSTGTFPDFGQESQKKTVFNHEFNLGEWFSGPLSKNGNTVSLPFSTWSDGLELEIQSSKMINGKRVDTLVGKDVIYDGFHYAMTCEAIVVDTPSHIENNTASCP